MKLCFAQLNPTVGDIQGNAKKIIDALTVAKKQGAELVVFPEMVVTGYPPKDLVLHRNFIDENLAAVQEIVRASKGIGAVVGFIDRVEGKLYNSAAVVVDGTVLGVQHKTHLPTYDVFDEHRWFAQSQESHVFSINQTKIGVAICEDLWLDGPIEQLKAKGAELIIALSASPFHTNKELVREHDVLGPRAAKNQIAIAYCNLVGGQDDLIFDGHSYLFNAQGQKVFEAPSFEEGLFLADITTANPITSKAVDRVEQMTKALVLGVRDYFRKNGFTKAVIGLSGGIDSAVTAVIAVEALGKENVLGITMPNTFSSQGSVDDSITLARNLGIELRTIPITGLFTEYLRLFSKEFKGLPENIAEENIQARIRGNILMAFSNKLGHLVLSTGNKSEVATGYCTLYGDMCGGLAVISDLLKRDVYAIAHYYNTRKSKEIVPVSTITKAPSAELRPNQKDSDSLPEYDILDPILERFIEQGKDFDDVVNEGFDALTVERVMNLVRVNEYKRKQAALGLKITPKAFGSGRQFPITNRWKK
jgi:NAD+ synthase (glutamine-hydrolysing)